MKTKLLWLVMLPLLAGCAGYRASKLRKLATRPVQYHENIRFAAKAFDYTDCNAYLGRNVIVAGYTPIQVAVKNKSLEYLKFSLDKINLKAIPANVVAESVYFSVRDRALGYGIPGIFIWPFLIPAVVDSIWADEANKLLLRDYLEKAIQDKTIVPDSELEGLIFVANNDYKNQIEVTLIAKDSLEKIICKTYL